MDADAVRRAWSDRLGEYSPDYYAHYGPNATSEAVRERLDAAVDPDDAVLEVGCSSGRHLAHLHDHGYRDLHGIDINPDAFDVMRETNPDLAAAGTFHCDAIERVLSEFDDGRFDAVYSVETLQHLHPDSEWVFGEAARLVDDVLVTVEIERDESREPDASSEAGVTYVDDDVPMYRRDWHRVFTDLGLVGVDAEELGTDTLRVFRTAGP